MSEGTQRRLAAIVCADVVGYSRLMGGDEAGTLDRLKSLRKELVQPAIAKGKGRIVKLMGDGLLAEFPSIVKAIQCAVDIQEQMVERETEVPEESRIRLRIGVNLGDIIVEGSDIYGDGVNIAARLEGLAAPGGICVSGAAFDAVEGKLDLVFEDMGQQEVKNIAKPVRAYRLAFSIPRAAPPARQAEQLSLPDKPSIAVLPFDNMSGDPDQEYFADGMTEDLITDLSKVSGLFVVARNSSFAYKAKAVDVRTVAAELGVRYILQGSIRKLGDRVRINAQLIDAKTGENLWAERYDRPFNDVFKLQDEVGAKVVTALSVQLTPGEAESLKRVHTNNVAAYEMFIRARESRYPPVPERARNAIRLFKRVIEMDPEFAGGYAGVSSMLGLRGLFGYGDAEEATDQAIKMAEKAIAVDETFGWSYIALGYTYLANGWYEDAVSAGREAIARQPSDADSHADLGLILGFSGKYTAGVEAIDQALRLNPRYFDGHYLNVRGIVQTMAGNYEAGLASFQENIDRGGPVATPVLAFSAAAHEGLEQSDEAAMIAKRLRAEFPRFTITNWNFLKIISDDAVRERLVKLMRTAGVP